MGLGRNAKNQRVCGIRDKDLKRWIKIYGGAVPSLILTSRVLPVDGRKHGLVSIPTTLHG